MLYLRVRGFKSLAEFEVTFDRVSVLIGPPASGKSNILEAIELIGYLLRVAIEAKAGVWGYPPKIGYISDYIRVRACSDILSHYEPRETAHIGLYLDGYEVKVSLECTSSVELRANVEIKEQREGLPTVAFTTTINVSASAQTERREQGILDFAEFLLELPQIKRVVAVSRLPSTPRVENLRITKAQFMIPSTRLYGFDRLGIILRIASGDTGSHYPLYPAEDARNLGWLLYSNRLLYSEVRSLVETISGLELRVLSDGKILFFDGIIDVPPGSVSDTVVRLIYTAVALLATNVIERRLASARVRLEPIVMIEEPEAHVYPAAFSHLVDLVKRAAKHAHVIITTHSGRLAGLLWEKVGANIYYVDRDKKGTIIHRVDMNKLTEKMYDLDDLLYLGREVLRD